MRASYFFTAIAVLASAETSGPDMLASAGSILSALKSQDNLVNKCNKFVKHYQPGGPVMQRSPCRSLAEKTAVVTKRSKNSSQLSESGSQNVLAYISHSLAPDYMTLLQTFVHEEPEFKKEGFMQVIREGLKKIRQVTEKEAEAVPKVLGKTDAEQAMKVFEKILDEFDRAIKAYKS